MGITAIPSTVRYWAPEASPLKKGWPTAHSVPIETARVKKPRIEMTGIPAIRRCVAGGPASNSALRRYGKTIPAIPRTIYPRNHAMIVYRIAVEYAGT